MLLNKLKCINDLLSGRRDFYVLPMGSNYNVLIQSLLRTLFKCQLAWPWPGCSVG